MVWSLNSPLDLLLIVSFGPQWHSKSPSSGAPICDELRFKQPIGSFVRDENVSFLVFLIGAPKRQSLHCSSHDRGYQRFQQEVTSLRVIAEGQCPIVEIFSALPSASLSRRAGNGFGGLD
jgi:hypothetical protein